MHHFKLEIKICKNEGTKKEICILRTSLFVYKMKKNLNKLFTLKMLSLNSGFNPRTWPISYLYNK